MRAKDQRAKTTKLPRTVPDIGCWDKMPKKAALVRRLSSVYLPFTTTLHLLSTQLRFCHQKSWMQRWTQGFPWVCGKTLYSCWNVCDCCCPSCWFRWTLCGCCCWGFSNAWEIWCSHPVQDKWLGVRHPMIVDLGIQITCHNHRRQMGEPAQHEQSNFICFRKIEDFHAATPLTAMRRVKRRHRILNEMTI